MQASPRPCCPVRGLRSPCAPCSEPLAAACPSWASAPQTTWHHAKLQRRRGAQTNCAELIVASLPASATPHHTRPPRRRCAAAPASLHRPRHCARRRRRAGCHRRLAAAARRDGTARANRPPPAVHDTLCRHCGCCAVPAVTAVAAPYRRSLRLGPYRRHQAWSAAPRPLRLLGGGGRLAHPATGRHSAVAWAPVWLDGVLLP